MDWKLIQKHLRSLGFDPGPLDGIRGRKTIDAVKRFQESRWLGVDGIVGPITLNALLVAANKPQLPPEEAVQDAWPWLDTAHRLLLSGVKEAPGPANNPLIMGWGKKLKIDYARDEIPWCGLFVGHCVAEALPTEPLPTNPLGARNWAKFGIKCKPQPGAVMVFWRGSKDGWQGHVGFYKAEDDTAYQIVGGNQSNAVTVARMAKNRLLASRWPKTAFPPVGGAVKADATGALSTNEA